ncbi:MAG: metal ABC transporter permease [Limnohabitans sp.]|jgi:manganese/zinc/iron transport system permease protein|nr:metal ABC transporter permease [Limnohabitans sp.]
MIGANTMLVLAGCALFGAVSGATGTFVLARRRALVSDVAGHAALPGVALGFLLGEVTGLGGRSPALLVLCATITALFAALCVAPLARLRRLGDDGATATMLAGSFGLGAALLSIVQSHASGAQGGLQTLLLGSAAAMRTSDVVVLTVLSLIVVATLTVLARGLAMVAFDEEHARVAGVPVRALDFALIVLLVACVVAGLQVAGVVLVVAFILTPAATARLFAGSLRVTALRAAMLGTATAVAGVLASRVLPTFPTGSAMTLAASLVFFTALVLHRKHKFAERIA